MNPTALYLGTWPPSRSIEPAGTGSATDGSWPPPESAEHAGTGSHDDDWPPREADDDMLTEQAGKPVDEHVIEMGPEWQEVPTSRPEAPKPWTPPVHTSEYMKSLQKVVDASTDEQMLWMRAGGCDLQPARWRGVLPQGMPERPGSTE